MQFVGGLGNQPVCWVDASLTNVGSVVMQNLSKALWGWRFSFLAVGFDSVACELLISSSSILARDGVIPMPAEEGPPIFGGAFTPLRLFG